LVCNNALLGDGSAIANFPDVLLLDEPTGDLDSKNTEIVMKILVQLNRQHGMTLVMVTHDIHLRQFADRILHLRDGKLHHEEIPDERKRERLVSDLLSQTSLPFVTNLLSRTTLPLPSHIYTVVEL
jgi:ABC-type methionine transport system ATPase subunit